MSSLTSTPSRAADRSAEVPPVLAVVQELCQRGIPLSYLSSGGWFYGITHGMSHKNVELRRRQYAAASDTEKCLTLARRFVQAKIANPSA